MKNSWKSFWLGTFSAVIIAFIAGAIFDVYSDPSSERFSSENVRLDK